MALKRGRFKVDDEERLEYILSRSKVYAPDIPKPEINRRHMVTKPKDGFEIENIMKRLEYNGTVCLLSINPNVNVRFL